MTFVGIGLDITYCFLPQLVLWNISCKGIWIINIRRVINISLCSVGIWTNIIKSRHGFILVRLRNIIGRTRYYILFIYLFERIISKNRFNFSWGMHCIIIIINVLELGHLRFAYRFNNSFQRSSIRLIYLYFQCLNFPFFNLLFSLLLPLFNIIHYLPNHIKESLNHIQKIQNRRPLYIFLNKFILVF